MLVARSDVQKAEGQIQQAKSAHQQTLDELGTKRGPSDDRRPRG